MFMVTGAGHNAHAHDSRHVKRGANGINILSDAYAWASYASLELVRWLWIRIFW